MSFGVFWKDPKALGLCFLSALIFPLICPIASQSSWNSSKPPLPCSVVFMFLWGWSSCWEGQACVAWALWAVGPGWR